MSLDDFGNVADLLAALGVIASLIYVGYQVKETRRAIRAATAQARTDIVTKVGRQPDVVPFKPRRRCS